MKPGLFILLLFSIVQIGYSQNDDLLIGRSSERTIAAFFDLSDPTGLNIEVSIWGFVKLPGRYKIPYKSTFLDLMSYAGGPIENSNLEEIRIYRPGNDSLNIKGRVTKLNYDDLLWGENISNTKKSNPVLGTGDIVLVLEEKRYNLRENIALYIPIVTSLISITTLIITLSR